MNITWQRSGWPKEIHRQAQEKHASQIHWHFSKELKKRYKKKIEVGLVSNKFRNIASFCVSEHVVCIHIRKKKKSGNPPTNHLGFFVAHGCGCPWWFPPSLADRRCHLLRIESGEPKFIRDRSRQPGPGPPLLKVRHLPTPQKPKGFR